MKNNLYPEYNLEIFDEYNGKSIDFKEVLTKNGFDNDISDYILKQMYYQSYINPVNWECYCNMNNKILKLKQEYFENKYNLVVKQE